MGSCDMEVSVPRLAYFPVLVTLVGSEAEEQG